MAQPEPGAENLRQVPFLVSRPAQYTHEETAPPHRITAVVAQEARQGSLPNCD
jgi:hypothetical protein